MSSASLRPPSARRAHAIPGGDGEDAYSHPIAAIRRIQRVLYHLTAHQTDHRAGDARCQRGQQPGGRQFGSGASDSDAKLAERETLLRLAQQVGRLALFDWDLITNQGTCSEPYFEIFGRDPGDLTTSFEQWIACIHPDDRQRIIEQTQHAIEGTEPGHADYRIVRTDGEIRWLTYAGQVLRDADGRPRRMLGIIVDITQRKQVEEALRKSELRFRTVQELSLDGSLILKPVYDQQGRIVDFVYEYVNQAAARMLGQPADQLIGQRLLATGTEDHGALLAHYRQVMESGAPQDIELRYTSREPAIWWRNMAVRVDDSLAVSILDITERKQAEESLKEAHQRKDEFMATLAHELRNPLAPIRNAVQLLRIAGPRDPDSQRAHDIIDRQVGQLSRLVDDLLDIARIARNKIVLNKERVALAAIVERAVEACQPIVAARTHTLTVVMPDEPAWLDVDLVRIGQVMSNLLNNAAKYTPAGGHIELSAQRAGAHALIRVSDNGIGISPAVLSRVFELFTQLEAPSSHPQGGLGIGLTIVKQLVEMHGGSVEATSAGLGLGSQFTVKLPLAPAPGAHAPQQPVEDADTPASSQQSLRILVVDDNRDSAETLAQLLRLHGHQAETAYDGVQALERARARPPQVVFLNLGMPGLDGYEVARRLRQQPATRSAVLAAMTGWGQEEDRRRTREAGFDHHLIKPVDFQLVDDIVSSYHTGP